MITTGILYLIYSFIFITTAPIRLLPDAVLSTSLTQSIATAGTYLKSLDFVFPVSSFIGILVLLIVIEAGILGYKLIMWVLRKIPGIS